MMQPLISKWTFSSPFCVRGIVADEPSLHIPSDVVFAALWRTAQAIGKEMQLMAAVIDDRLFLSDALPFAADDALYLPQLFASRPYRRASGADGVPTLHLAQRSRGEKVHAVTVAPADSGLYVLVRTTADLQPLLDELFVLLGMNGIGAGRSAGWGQFTATPLQLLDAHAGADAAALATAIAEESGAQMSLSASAPVEPTALQRDASYAFLPRCWHLADGREEPYVLFAAGSVFPARFAGHLLHHDDCLDEASSWRLAQPFFMGVPSWSA